MEEGKEKGEGVEHEVQVKEQGEDWAVEEWELVVEDEVESKVDT